VLIGIASGGVRSGCARKSIRHRPLGGKGKARIRLDHGPKEGSGQQEAIIIRETEKLIFAAKGGQKSEHEIPLGSRPYR